MKKISLYTSALLLAAVGLGGCSNHWELPPMLVPTDAADVEATISIAELKAMYWDDSNTGYVTPIELLENGQHPIIKGTIVSSTVAGNIYKTVYIQDETAAIALSVDTNNLQNVMPMGVQVAIDMAGLQIGRYRGMMQAGVDNNGEVGRIAYHQLEPNLAFDYFGGTVDTTVTTLAELMPQLNGNNGQLNWQGKLVRLNGVQFMEAGLDFCEPGSATNRTITDGDGHRMTVRTSTEADFAFSRLPLGKGDLVGILSYFNGWQFLLNDIQGCIDFEGGDPGEMPTLPDPAGAGTVDDPYNCATVIAMNPQSTTDAVESGIWMSGYIVGYYNDYIGHYEAEGAVNTNILMCDIPEPAYDAQCVSVQLPNGAVRSALNLANNPGLLGQKVAVYGDVMKYNSLPGIKNTSNYMLEGGSPEGPDQPAQPDAPTGVISVAEAIALINAGSTATVQVSGVVSSVKSFYSNYGQIDYYIVDEGQTQQLQVYNGLGLNKAKFSAITDIEVGAKVIVEGPLADYNGTPEINRGNFLVSYTAPSGGGNTGGSTTTGTIFSQTFASGQGNFTIDDITLPSALSYVWKHDASYSCMKASAFVNSTDYAADSWLVSPVIDLSSTSTAYVSFEQAVNYFSSLDAAKTEATINIRPEGGSWTTLTIPSYPTALGWTFVPSGSINISSFAGQKVQIGFHYTSSSKAGTWEVKNLVVSANN